MGAPVCSSLVYLTSRRIPDDLDHRGELGAAGHGPHGGELAERLCHTARAWNHDRAAQPADAHTAHGPGLTIRKDHAALYLEPTAADTERQEP
ncbi:MAG: hypothetical protein JO100_18430 [Pseudonocardia sp.]|nr:hypothetical protein [Pseudonocardia sp.]